MSLIYISWLLAWIRPIINVQWGKAKRAIKWVSLDSCLHWYVKTSSSISLSFDIPHKLKHGVLWMQQPFVYPFQMVISGAQGGFSICYQDLKALQQNLLSPCCCQSKDRYLKIRSYWGKKSNLVCSYKKYCLLISFPRASVLHMHMYTHGF